MGTVGLDCSGSTGSFACATLLLALRNVRHVDLTNPYSHLPTVSRPSASSRISVSYLHVSVVSTYVTGA
jgi:hypothetical protein